MTVIIAGAGISGLTLGLSLFEKAIPFQIFESVSELRPLGLGINLQPHAVRELTEMGFLNQLDQIGLRTEEVAYFSEYGTHIWSELRGIKAGYSWPQFSIHRGKLQMLLLGNLLARAGEGCVIFGKQVNGVKTTSQGVTVTMEDRSTGVTQTVVGKVLVGADGINSQVRAILHPQDGPPSWGGTIMLRGATIGPRFLTGRSVTMTGVKDRKFVAYPIADVGTDKSLINWIADLSFPADHKWLRQDWNRAGSLDDFLPDFTDWNFDWLDVPAIIKGADTPLEFPMVDRNPLDQWTFGNATLTGDAAHAMYPIGSNGASQCIVDVRVLTQSFIDNGVTQNALQAYEDIRRPVTNAIVLANRGDGPDKILDEVATRAPNGFTHIRNIMSEDELKTVASKYKTIAGFDVDDLNSRPNIVR